MLILGQTACRGSADKLRVSQKVAPDHFFAARRRYVMRIDIDQLDSAPIGTSEKMIPGSNIAEKSPTLVSRACFFAKSRARWFLGAHDGIDERLASAWPGRAI